MVVGRGVGMTLTSLQTIIDQVAASDTYKDIDFDFDTTQQAKNRGLLSAEVPPDLYDPDVIIDFTDAIITVKPGIGL